MSLQQTVTVKILNNEYTVKFPNTGEQMNIDLLKLQLSDGKYEQLKYSMNSLLVRQASVVETIATFNVLIPKLKKDLNVTAMSALEQEQMDIIVDAYEQQFLPFYEVLMTELQAKRDSRKKAEKKEGEKDSE